MCSTQKKKKEQQQCCRVEEKEGRSPPAKNWSILKIIEYQKRKEKKRKENAQQCRAQRKQKSFSISFHSYKISNQILKDKKKDI